MRERRRLDDLVDHRIALARGWRADQISLVCDPHVQRSRIGLRIDRDHPHAEAFRGARDAHGDLATIGDQDRTEHRKVLAQGRAEWHGHYRVVLRLTAWGQDSARAGAEPSDFLAAAGGRRAAEAGAVLVGRGSGVGAAVCAGGLDGAPA